MLIKYSHILSEVGHILAPCETPEQQLQVAQQHMSQAHLKARHSPLSQNCLCATQMLSPPHVFA